jgi:hypothetical protein
VADDWSIHVRVNALHVRAQPGRSAATIVDVGGESNEAMRAHVEGVGPS